MPVCLGDREHCTAMPSTQSKHILNSSQPHHSTAVCWRIQADWITVKIQTERERQRETEKETETERQRETERKRQTERFRARQRERQRERQRQRDPNRETEAFVGMYSLCVC